jgi:hypothetical protein
VLCFKRNKYVSLPQSVVNFLYFNSWGRRRSSDTLTNIYARQIPSNFSFLFVCFLSGGKNCLSRGRWAARILNVQFVCRYYRNVIYEDNYNKSNNEQAQTDRMLNHDTSFIPRMYVGTWLINYLKDVKLRSYVTAHAHSWHVYCGRILSNIDLLFNCVKGILSHLAFIVCFFMSRPVSCPVKL